MTSKFQIFLLVIITTLLLPLSALARSGYVSGTIKNFNHLGGYCEATSSINCTGAKYLKSSYDTYKPVKHAKIFIVAVINQGANESVYSLGESSTDAQGRFVMSWYISPSMQTLFNANNTWCPPPMGQPQYFEQDERIF